MLNTAVEHYGRQATATALGLIAARRAWEQSADRLLAVVTALQVSVAAESAAAVPAMLEEQGISPEPIAVVVPAALAGVASDGRGLASLLAQAETRAQFDMIVETQLQDVARHSAATAIAARPQVAGYVRMVNPGACSRCIVLAGKFYRWNEGFKRHPKCGCRHIPAAENAAGDAGTDPIAYFDSMSVEQQNRAFTAAGAEAIRMGADMGQVVNARRGMQTAQVAGSQVVTTTSGSGRTPRLMPETILAIARNRDDALRLLKLHGFITD